MGTEPTSWTIQMLKDITLNFSEERVLGQGAYGKVYKGVCGNGEQIAVKLLHNNMQETNDEQFQHEFNNLMMLNHRNIVRLVGYCYETQRQPVDFQGRTVFAETTYRALCFEYMHKGSLQRHLSDEIDGHDWNTRYKIIKGACKGLEYLHKGSNEPIYHLDLKPDNILLDENMIPKLADFGLSKLFGEEQTRVTYNTAGTFGYMPPEYLLRQVISNKLDVFSLGVVITKIIAGPKGHSRSGEMPCDEFLGQILHNWRNRLEKTCTSPRILEAYCQQVSVCTEIGLNSMESDRDKRPSIVQIVQRLDDTETMIEKAILWSANSRSLMPVKCQREKNDDTLVKVQAFAGSKAIHQGDETCGEFPVLVRVSGVPWRPAAAEMSHAGVDLVVVLNVTTKYVKAIMMLVSRLGPDDRLSILFGGICRQQVTDLMYMSEQGRDIARLKISELAHSDVVVETKYVRPALPMAAQILRQRGVEESSSRTGCILHMWDDDVYQIHKYDISQEFPVHTIALGYYYRPREMKLVADITPGTSSFVDSSWDLKEIGRALALFVARITSRAARSVRITIQAAQGVTISSIVSARRYGNLVISSDKRSGTVYLHNICNREQKSLIVYLTVPQGKQKLLTVGGVYKGLSTSKEIAGVDVELQPRHWKCTPDEVTIHPKVAAELLRIRLRALLSSERGSRTCLHRLIDTAMDGSFDKDSNDMKSLWGEMKDSEEGRNTHKRILSALRDVAEMRGRYGDEMELYCKEQDSGCQEWESGAFQEILERQHVAQLKLEGLTRNEAIAHSFFSKQAMHNETCVLVRVSAAHTGEMPRDGVDVVAVFDISRNMQAEMLECVKQAMMIVIDKLAPNDRLSIVCSEARVMDLAYMSDDRNAARFKITQLEAANGRCMSHIAAAALREGAQILHGRRAEESSRRLGFILFLSDGDYPGISRIQTCPGFPVHTFGLGAAHNPKVMKCIADITSGTYSFVHKDVSNIKDALELFITGLTSIAATSITITLMAHPGNSISSIESGDYIHSLQSNKMFGTIIIDHIYAGERKEFIVNLTVRSDGNELMTIGGQYRSFGGSKLLDEMNMSVRRPYLIHLPEDLAIQPDVAAELTRVRLRNSILDMLERQQLTSKRLEQLWNMIRHSDEGRGAPEETMSSLNMGLDEMNRDISGMPYTLSWLSCHMWQRATTKGTANNSRDFQTIAQHAEDDTHMVKVGTFTRSKAIPSQDPCNNFPVMVRVSVAPWRCTEKMPRAGIDIVAVLDISERMKGEKLHHMRQAMMVVIDTLGADDRLSIVSFNTYENRLMKLTYMSDHERDVARLKINKLVAGGQNDMGAALREGAQILWWRGAESSSRVACMMLLSDGEYPEIFQTELNTEFPVHTFGLGSNHNPKVMKYIADMTFGTYSFINQGIHRIKDAVELFITGLTSVAAMSIKITIGTDEGITISSIDSGGYSRQVKSDNRSGTIEVGNIYAGERKDFLVNLRVAEGKKKLMTISGRYLCHNTGKHLADTGVYVLRPHQECASSELAIDPDVAAELVRIRLEKGISTMLEQGPSGIGLQQLWDGIMDSDEGRGAPEETLLSLSMDLTEMARDIESPEKYRKWGLPYTLSWLSSHKWQRATCKGAPSSSGAFQTTVQDADGRTRLSR